MLKTIMDRRKRIRVQVLELNGDTPTRKYPIDQAGCVEISFGGGAGNIKETPKIVPEAYHRRGRWPVKRNYLIYPRLSNAFLVRGEHTAPPVSIELIKKLINTKAMQAYIGKDKPNWLGFMALIMLAFLIFLQVS